MGRREEAAWMKGTVGLTAARERGDIGRQFQNRLTMTRSSIDRLGLEKELHGHTGCVNCLEWNRDGSVLASASDDLHVILWDPYRYRQLHKIVTGHTGNIFSVKFLTADKIVTCAADGTVRARSIVGGASLLECSCHCGRVKRLAAAPDHTQIVWSAAEDGFVLQHDLRTPHSCNSESANVVINLLNHLGRFSEAKCVAVNPRRPYQLAVGANDYYVRMYDVRMIKLAKLQSLAPSSRQSWDRQNIRSSRAGHGDPDNNIPKEAVQYFAPGHLQWPHSDLFPKKAITYVAFNNDGNELLVNMGSEQIYIFDIDNAPAPVLVDSFIIQQNHAAARDPCDPRDSCDPCDPRDPRDPRDLRDPREERHSSDPRSAEQPLPPHIDMLKEMGNRLVAKGKFTSAIDVYNHALSKYEAAVLYSNKAAALMRRGWVGDTYAAIKDCYRAIKLDPAHVKSHFRLAKALMDMKRPREAQECLLYFKNKFPKHSSSHAVFLLQKDINVALEDAGMPDEPDDTESEELQKTSNLERQLRAGALDYKQRFLGHCNTTTDIKEANFLGPDANFIAAGSDDGSMFIWCRATGNIVRCLRGDESIVNCIQPQPATCMLATSGIETVVRLWSPRPEDGVEEPRLVDDGAAAAAANQQRMRSDPFEAMLINIAGNHHHEPPCRPT